MSSAVQFSIPVCPSNHGKLEVTVLIIGNDGRPGNKSFL